MKSHKEICNALKDIHIESVYREWDILKELTLEALQKINGRNRLGCDLLDYYFFEQRLETIGNKGIHFFEFVEKIEFYKTKKYIQTLLTYCDTHNRYKDNLIKKYYYCYGLCFGRINAFKITNALQIYHTFQPKVAIFDPFCGFGGRLVAALLLRIHYIGIDLNVDLKDKYAQLMEDLADKIESNVDLLFTDSLKVDFTNYQYDMVFTSSPYENIEIYKHSTKKT